MTFSEEMTHFHLTLDTYCIHKFQLTENIDTSSKMNIDMNNSDVATFDTTYYHSKDFQKQLDSALPRNDLSCDLSSTINSPVRSDTLHRLLFSDNISSSSLEFDWDACEASTDIGTPFSFEDSALEPCPIDENKMKVLQNGSNDESSFVVWRTQEQRQLKNLLSMVFYPESVKSGSRDHPAESSSGTAKRGLDQFMDHDSFRPIKKQRVVSSAMKKDNSSSPLSLPSVEDSPRFRDYQSCQWSTRWEEVEQFRLQKGHCYVPHGYQANPELARWVKRQRYQYKLRANGKASTMTDERISALEQLGFVWDSHGVAWMERFNELNEYFLSHGTCTISSSYIKSRGRTLSSWVKFQRRQYRIYNEGGPSTTTPDRITKLENIGFQWDLRSCRNTASPNFTQ